VTTVSKIRYFLITLTITIVLGSCNKKNDVIPDVYVDFNLNINDPEFINLNSTGGSVEITSRTNNGGYRSAGYDNNGIIVTAGGFNEFYAYDRTCPHDYMLNGNSIKVTIDATGFAKAVCPECKTVYELINFGTPSSGPSRYPLKNYKTSFDNGYIRVWNNY
jgi:nitrite reductase/ring-hydroxylating ferredoxin subunit